MGYKKVENYFKIEKITKKRSKYFSDEKRHFII